MQTARLYLLVLLSFSVPACGDNSQAPVEKQADEPTEISDDLLLRLSAEISPNPRTRAEEEKNMILNYAIDNNLAVQSTASGLFYYIEKQGEGELLKWGDRVSAEYTGQLLDGKVFDSTAKRREALTFYIGNMIDGWNEGLQLLRPGGKAVFLIPSALAYQETGIEGLIPADAVLHFDLEVTEKVE